MSKQALLFKQDEPPKRPRKPRQWRMHVIDAGCAGSDFETPAQVDCVFECSRCDFRSEWIRMATVTDAKRGIPCPICNGLPCPKCGEPYYRDADNGDNRPEQCDKCYETGCTICVTMTDTGTCCCAPDP